jgi:hypothetical protein
MTLGTEGPEVLTWIVKLGKVFFPVPTRKNAILGLGFRLKVRIGVGEYRIMNVRWHSTGASKLELRD